MRHDLFDRVHIGLDFFDASINRIAAWVIGTRNMKKALLRALLEPTAELRKLEAAGDYTARLALLEEQKSLPWQAVWEMYCQRHDTPAGTEIAGEHCRLVERNFESPRVNTAGCGVNALSGLRNRHHCRPDKTRQRRIRHLHQCRMRRERLIRPTVISRKLFVGLIRRASVASGQYFKFRFEKLNILHLPVSYISLIHCE